MRKESSTLKTSRKRVRKKLVASVASAALALSMLPATAFAAASVNEDGYVTYKLPTEPMSLQMQKKDASGNEYTQEYLSISLAAPPMNQPYFSLLGINNTALGRTIVSGGNTETQYGLFGSDANVQPDTYLYNYCAFINGATVPADSMCMSSGNTTVTIDGTEYNMPRDVYTETSMIRAAGSDVKSGDLTWAEWVALENKRPNRSKTGVYDPAYVTVSNNSGSAYTMTASLYTLADVCDKIIEDSKDANGNYTKATRYAEGPNTHSVVNNYEDIVKGTQYYLISRINAAQVKKATVAVVCGYDGDTGNYAVRKIHTGISGDYGSNRYAGRISGAVSAIANDLTELGLEPAQDAYVGTNDESAYVVWYTPQQIVENCDAVLVTDAPAGNNVSTYLATASNGKPMTVSACMDGLTKAKADAEASGKKAADLCYNWPASLFGVYYAQGCENVVLSLVGECFLYPEIYDLTDVMAWWAKNVWHITDSALQDIVDSTCYNVSLSANQSQIHTIDADFESRIDNMIKAGNAYYLANSFLIDGINDGVIKTNSVEELSARVSDRDIAEAVAKQIQELPTAITSADDAAVVEAARTAFNDLSAAQKSQVNRILGSDASEAIEAAEQKVTEYNDGVTKAAEDAAKADADAAKAVADAIAALPDASASTSDTKAAADAAKELLASLTDEQKALIPAADLAKLEAVSAAADKAASLRTQTIDAEDVTVTFGDKAFKLGASTSGDGVLTYSTSDANVVDVDQAGKVTVKGAGIAEITITAAETDFYKSATKTVTVNVGKAKNPITLAKKSATLKASQLKKAKKTVAINKAKKAQGKVTYSIYKVNKSKKYFSINKTTGKITVKKGLKKGTYKVTVKAVAAGNANYKKLSKTAAVTIKVK